MPEPQKIPTAKRAHGRYAHLLNESQRRSLSVTLRRVELAVWRLEERLAREPSPDLVLTRFTNAPNEAQRAALLKLVIQVRSEVARIAEDYNLEEGEENFLRSVMGEFTLLWADLEDTRPQKLRRYGAVHPQIQDALGPPIQRLIHLMLAIDNIAKGE